MQIVGKIFDRFLFESCDPRMASVLRIAYATLLLVYVAVWSLDGSRWFSNEGVLSVDTAQRMFSIPYWSLFFFDSSNGFVHVCLAILFLQSGLLLVGCWSRFQSACIFVWLTSFQHRNLLVCDGEDTVFRLFAFFFIFLPLDTAWSMTAKRHRAPLARAQSSSAWGLRLIQIEITAIYLSAGWSKLQGATWRDGSALYHVSRMDDFFGRFGLLESLFDFPWFVLFATWISLAIELILPFALWFKPTRRAAIVAGIVMHLSIEVSMNLFLFEWIMIVGLLSFVKPEEWGFCARGTVTVLRRASKSGLGCGN